MKKLRRLFSVYIHPKTYLILIYLLLSFPLGLIYFISLVIGFSTGFGLSIIIIGVLIVILTLLLARFFISLERWLAHWLLQIPVIQHNISNSGPYRSIAGKVFKYIRSPQTWTGLLYLLLKFPIGIVTFSIVVFLLASSFSLLASPITYQLWENHFWGPGILFWKIDSFGEGIVGFVIGALLLTISLNITNYLGWLVGVFTRWMLYPRPPKQAHLPK